MAWRNYFLYYLLSLLMGGLHASGGPDPVIKTRKYHEVYDMLVCAVLEGNVKKFYKALKRGHDPKQKLSFGRNLRHVAYNSEIDEKLIELGVACPEKVEVWTVSKGVMNNYNLEHFQYMTLEKYILSLVKNGELNREDISSQERDPGGADFYGKFPENFSLEKKKEIAAGMIRSYYTEKLRE